MGLEYLLDTNALSEPVKPTPSPDFLRRLAEHSQVLCTAAPVWHELVFGTRRLPNSRRRRELERYLDEVVQASMTILPYDTQAADWHAAERARLGALGSTPPFVDGQIAAIARVRDLTLVTRNVSDFESFAGLAVEDWTQGHP